MYRKEDVRFPAEGGIELSAWLFVPRDRSGDLFPAITMAHGYAGTKYHGIEPMAQAFAEAGFRRNRSASVICCQGLSSRATFKIARKRKAKGPRAHRDAMTHRLWGTDSRSRF